VRAAATSAGRDWSLGAVLAERAIDPRTCLLVVRADAGVAAALDLRRRLLALRLAGHTTLLVDLEGMNTVSDAILAALMQARRQLAARDGRLVVTSEHAAVRTAAEQVGLELVDHLESE
jgi:anti-anti-sigma regulatory factor